MPNSHSAISPRAGNLHKLSSQKETRAQPKLSRVTSVRYRPCLVVNFEIALSHQRHPTPTSESDPGEALTEARANPLKTCYVRI